MVFTKATQSIKNIFVGVFVFFIAFPVLWWGENRKNAAEYVDDAKMIESQVVPDLSPGTLVKTEGMLTTTESITDAQFLTASSEPLFLRLTRDVQMYAWKEKKKTEKVDGKETTSYIYDKEWTSSPADSSKFKESGRYFNPTLQIKRTTWQVKNAKIGVLPFSAAEVDFQGSESFSVADIHLNRNTPQVLQAAFGKIYVAGQNPLNPDGSPRKVADNPEIGDLNLSYTFFPNGVEGSLVGSWDGQQITAYKNGSEEFFGAYKGNLKAFRDSLQAQHTFFTWMIRIVAFFMMWFGIKGVVGPVLLVMDYVPIVGSLGRGAINLVTALISGIFWMLTILLSNIWVMLAVAVVLVGGAVLFAKKSLSSQSPAGTA